MDPFPTPCSKIFNSLNNTRNNNHFKYITARHHQLTQSITTYPSTHVPRSHCSQGTHWRPFTTPQFSHNLQRIKNTMNILLQPGQYNAVFILHSPPRLTPTQNTHHRTATKLKPNHNKRSSTWNNSKPEVQTAPPCWQVRASNTDPRNDATSFSLSQKRIKALKKT